MASSGSPFRLSPLVRQNWPLFSAKSSSTLQDLTSGVAKRPGYICSWGLGGLAKVFLAFQPNPGFSFCVLSLFPCLSALRHSTLCLPGSRFVPLWQNGCSWPIQRPGYSRGRRKVERVLSLSLHPKKQEKQQSTPRRGKVQVPMARFLTPAIPGSVLFVRSSGSLFNYHGTLTSQVHGLQEEVIPRRCQPAGRSRVVGGGLWPC